MRVVLCLDKFRGSATGSAAGVALARGLRRRCPTAEVLNRPVADGGEGTVEALVAAGYSARSVTVSDPLGRPVRARFAVRGRTAVVEMAQASGLDLRSGALDPLRASGALDPLRASGALDPLRASTAGTGQLIAAARRLGCTRVVLAVGGSATTDGGAGMLQALGARLDDAEGRPVGPGGVGLLELDRLELDRLDPALRVVLATDVDNPLLGERGAAAVFGPQKGASPSDVRVLEAGLTRFAEAMASRLGRDLSAAAGAGAGGGLGFGALAGLGATRVPGVDYLIGELGLADVLAEAHLVVVGEGRLDAQSLAGKAPVGVARLARGLGVPVFAVAGEVRLDERELRALGISRSFAILDRAPDLATAIADAEPILAEIGAEIGDVLASW